MDRSLTVSTEPENNKWNGTNRWLVRPFNAISTNEAMNWDTDDEDSSDCIFINMVPRPEFDIFVRFVPDTGQKTP